MYEDNCFLFMSRRKVFNQKGTYTFQNHKHLLFLPFNAKN